MIGIMQGRLSPSEELMFFPFDTWENEFAMARDIGFDAIEWAFYEERHEHNPLWSGEGIKRIKKLAKKHSIQIYTLCAGYFIRHRFIGKEAGKSMAVLKRLIQNGSRIGVRIILIPFLGNSEIKNEEEKREIVKNLGSCLDTAAQYNITLAFETSLPAKELKDFISLFNHSGVKVYYDIGNCTTLVGDKVPEEIQELGNLISAVHIKDRKFGDATSLPLGKGDADFSIIFKALKKIRFTGPFTLEAARDKNIDDSTLNRGYLQFVKKYVT